MNGSNYIYFVCDYYVNGRHLTVLYTYLYNILYWVGVM